MASGGSQQQLPSPPLESAADVRRALRGMQQKQKLVNSTLNTLKKTQKTNMFLQMQAEKQNKRLQADQQHRECGAKVQRLATAAAAVNPAATEEEKKQILGKMLQLKSSVADIVDQEDGQRHLERLRSLEASDANHEFKQSIKEMKVTAFFCMQCNKFTDRLNAACTASGHHQHPRQATKRFVQCGGCGHKPIPTLNNQLPDGCPRCRVASKDLNFLPLSIYASKPERLLEQEKLSIDGTDVDPFKPRQPHQKQQRRDDEEAVDGILDHGDLPTIS